MKNSATLAVHVSPKAGRDEVVGIRTLEDGLQEVDVRVTAAPDKGAANKAVCKLLAKELGIPKTAVSVKRGQTARHKAIEIAADEHELARWLDGLPRIG
ncbi:MAG: DUF167 domain-containing protein [Eggerthellaceae bacterium]|nr:DUF167 domain-containing protein [Eggerthellaceae bacterium]